MTSVPSISPTVSSISWLSISLSLSFAIAMVTSITSVSPGISAVAVGPVPVTRLGDNHSEEDEGNSNLDNET